MSESTAVTTVEDISGRNLLVADKRTQRQELNMFTVVYRRSLEDMHQIFKGSKFFIEMPTMEARPNQYLKLLFRLSYAEAVKIVFYVQL